MEYPEGITNLPKIKKELKKQQKHLLIKKFLSNKLLVTGTVILAFLMLFTLFAPLLTSFTPYEMDVSIRLQKPSTDYFLGTDDFGRDIFSRIAHGAKVSMGVGFSVMILSTMLGTFLGLYASYYRVLDNIIMRICDGLMSIPAILLAIALMAAFGGSITNVIMALTIVFTPYIARVVRSTALSVREQTFIEAIKSQGARNLQIIWKHILPNTISPVIIQASFIFADAIIIEAALSFLGAGIPAPEPSWGNIVSDSKSTMTSAWWMTVAPSIMIILSVLGLNLFGDGLRDLLDPHDTNKKK